MAHQRLNVLRVAAVLLISLASIHIVTAQSEKPKTDDIGHSNKLHVGQPTDTTDNHGHTYLGHGNDNSSTGDHHDNHSGNHGEHHGIHVVGWQWEYVRQPLVITMFLVVTAICKLGFHHAGVLPTIFPESCLLILLGTAVGGVLYGIERACSGAVDTRVCGVVLFSLTPRGFFLCLLPPIILDSAYSLHDRVFGDNLGTVLLYAVIGTLFNCFVLGPCLYGLALSGAMGSISISLVQCLVFSSLIVAVDPVAVLAIFQEVGVNNVLYFLVFGESLLNDAVTVVLYNMMKAFNEMDYVPITQVLLGIASFFTISLGGLAIGLIYGALTSLLTKYTLHVRVIEPLAVFAFAYASYLTAELFHFSGIISIIGCGLTQAQYTFHNISNKSSTTILYFSKMMSATCDCIIFMFLGLALVRDGHVWHTGFVLWTIVLTLAIRFVGVYSLTFFANKVFRMRQVDYEEQFIMAYGGLRGAVAFSLVAMLNKNSLPHQAMFETTTLVVILFTVFVQGISIKPLVKLLRIRKSEAKVVSMYDEINKHVTDHLMAGIEEIVGYHGHNSLREVFDYYDDKYLKHVLQRKPQTKDDYIMELYQQIAMQEHFDNLAGAADIDRFPSQMELYKCEYSLDQNDPSFATLGNPELADRALDYHLHRKSLTPATSVELANAGGGSRRMAMHRIMFGAENQRMSDPGPEKSLTQDPEASRSLSHLGHSADEDEVFEEPSIKQLRKWLVKNPSLAGYHQKYDRNLTQSENNDLLHHLQEKHRRSSRYLRSLSSFYSPGSSAVNSPVGSHENLSSTRLSQLQTITEGKPTNGDTTTLSEPVRHPVSSGRLPVQMRYRRPRLAKNLTLDSSTRGSVPQGAPANRRKGPGASLRPVLDRCVSLDTATSDASPLLMDIPEITKDPPEKFDSFPQETTKESDGESNGDSSDNASGRGRRAHLSRQNKVRDISPSRKAFAGEDVDLNDVELGIASRDNASKVLNTSL